MANSFSGIHKSNIICSVGDGKINNLFLNCRSRLILLRVVSYIPIPGDVGVWYWWSRLASTSLACCFKKEAIYKLTLLVEYKATLTELNCVALLVEDEATPKELN